MSNNKLIVFLENVIENLREDNLRNDEFHHLIHFYMSYNIDLEEMIDNSERIRFLTLGLYVYKYILVDKTLV